MCIQLVLIIFQLPTSSSCRICVNFTPVLTLQQQIASYLSYFVKFPFRSTMCHISANPYHFLTKSHLITIYDFHPIHKPQLAYNLYVYIWYLHVPLLYCPLFRTTLIKTPLSSITGWSFVTASPRAP